MFKSKRKGNPYIQWLTTIMQDAIKAHCATVLIPLVEAFFCKLQLSPIKLLSTNQLHWERVVKLGITAKLLVQNTILYAVKDGDVEAFKMLFGELEALHSEVLENYTNGNTDGKISYKITVISAVIYSNTSRATSNSLLEDLGRDGMLFHNYEYLWKAIHKINTEWEDLRRRGFSQETFQHFCESVIYHRYMNAYHEDPDHLTFGYFENILDGNSKLVPVYECKPVSYEIVDMNSNQKRVVKEIRTPNSQVIQLKNKTN